MTRPRQLLLAGKHECHTHRTCSTARAATTAVTTTTTTINSVAAITSREYTAQSRTRHTFLQSRRQLPLQCSVDCNGFAVSLQRRTHPTQHLLSRCRCTRAQQLGIKAMAMTHAKVHGSMQHRLEHHTVLEQKAIVCAIGGTGQHKRHSGLTHLHRPGSHIHQGGELGGEDDAVVTQCTTCTAHRLQTHMPRQRRRTRHLPCRCLLRRIDRER